MKTEQKLFAFKVAKKDDETKAKSKQQWTARDGIATAGCTLGTFDYRYSDPNYGYDGGVYC